MVNVSHSNIILINMYIVISLFVLIADGITAFRAYREKKNNSSILGTTCIFAALVQITYLLSISAKSYSVMSFFFSLYFISVDLSVYTLLYFVRHYMIKNPSGWDKTIKNITTGYLILDIIFFFINIFHEIMIHYEFTGELIAGYSFVMKPLYYIHLCYTYIMVLMVIYDFFKSAKKVPRDYRRPFYLSIGSILLVVGINALFLYFPSLFGASNLDYSIWGYSLAAFSIFYMFYRYPSSGMKGYYHDWIVNNINQGIVLFNYEDTMIIHNQKMLQFFPDCDMKEGMHISKFAAQINSGIRQDKGNEDYSMQHYINVDGREHSVRLDHSCLRNSTGEKIGELFVFTDQKGDIDLLTSFYSWEYFLDDVKTNPKHFQGPVTAAVCDLNGLHNINKNYGSSVGDQAISILASAIRMHFGEDSYLVRGPEANLIILSFDLDENQTSEIIERIKNELLRDTQLECLLNMQGAVSSTKESDENIMNVIDQAMQSIRNKKLLDNESHRSELVTSLLKTLSECSEGTEAHVKRTQEMGMMLGRKLELSDVQLSDLALLCILHDIGKICIPLEILNKPTPLNESEYRMIRSHVEKGYQIAKSSIELDHIADMILHHHEKWDGSGYPDGLSKESIPLLSRIISVVDAYDAMIYQRPYKKILTKEEALEEMKRCAGTQFDPSIVNAFLQIIPQDTDDLLPKIENKEPETEQEELTNTLKENNIHTISYTRYILSDKGTIIEVDDNFEELTGYSRKDVEELELAQIDLIPESDVVDYMRTVSTETVSKEYVFLEHSLKRKDGSFIYVLCCGKDYFDSAIMKQQTEIIVFDSRKTYFADVIRKEESLRSEVRLSRWEDKYRSDSLTGLLNQESFKNDIELEILDHKDKIMFFMMDVDHFKQYNDTYGHKDGDEFLINFARTLIEIFPESARICRMGGDEFAVACIYKEGETDENMLKTASDICDKLNSHLSLHKGITSLSMGVTISDEKVRTFNDLYRNADHALYEAKEKGRARLAIYNGNND